MGTLNYKVFYEKLLKQHAVTRDDILLYNQSRVGGYRTLNPAQLVTVDKLAKLSASLATQQSSMSPTGNKTILYSAFTCGIMEIGRIYNTLNQEDTERTLVNAILVAFLVRKGRIIFYQPSREAYAPSFSQLGFTSQEGFYNPNTGNTVYPWVLDCGKI